MSTFDESQHPRGHHTNAGRFSEKSHTDPEVSLAALPAPVEQRVGGYKLSDAFITELPDWPASLPTPTAEVDIADTGGVMVTVTSGPDRFFLQGYEDTDIYTDLDDDDSPVPGWDTEQMEQARAWGVAALRRSEGLMSSVQSQVMQDRRLVKAINEMAAGRTPDRPKAIDEFAEAYIEQLDAKERVERASAKLIGQEFTSRLPEVTAIKLRRLPDGGLAPETVYGDGQTLGEWSNHVLHMADGRRIDDLDLGVQFGLLPTVAGFHSQDADGSWLVSDYNDKTARVFYPARAARIEVRR